MTSLSALLEDVDCSVDDDDDDDDDDAEAAEDLERLTRWRMRLPPLAPLMLQASGAHNGDTDTAVLPPSSREQRAFVLAGGHVVSEEGKKKKRSAAEIQCEIP
jgi:hypothetical protein